MAERSTKPYLIRAIHEWCSDNSFTPYLSVKVDDNTRVPMEYVKNGQRVLSTECIFCLTCTTVCPEGILRSTFKMDMGGKEIIKRR